MVVGGVETPGGRPAATSWDTSVTSHTCGRSRILYRPTYNICWCQTRRMCRQNEAQGAEGSISHVFVRAAHLRKRCCICFAMSYCSINASLTVFFFFFYLTRGSLHRSSLGKSLASAQLESTAGESPAVSKRVACQGKMASPVTSKALSQESPTYCVWRQRLLTVLYSSDRQKSLKRALWSWTIWCRNKVAGVASNQFNIRCVNNSPESLSISDTDLVCIWPVGCASAPDA